MTIREQYTNLYTKAAPVLRRYATVKALLALVAVLAGVGWLHSWYTKPIGQTIYRDKPVPVRVEVPKEVIKWQTKVVTKEVKVYVPTEKQAAKFEQQFGFSPKDRDILAIGTIPVAPEGGAVAVSVLREGGQAEITFTPKAKRFLQFGGIREVAIWYNPLDHLGQVEYSQDLLRTGPVVWRGRVYGVAGSRSDFGLAIGAAVRF
jgi:hypothetical protein